MPPDEPPTDTQHLKKRSDRAEFDSIERADRLFEVRLGSDDAPLIKGDFITFEEWDTPKGAYTGRRMSFRVSHTDSTRNIAKKNGWSDEEVTRRGIDIYGLQPPEYRRLRSIFAHSFVISLVIRKDDPGNSWDIMDGPTFLPFLLCPVIDIGSLVHFSNVDKWPPGLYAVHWMIDIDNPEKTTTTEIRIVDMLVWTWTSEIDGEQHDQLFLQELSPTALRAGDIINIDGKKILPMHPASIDELDDDPEEFIDEREEMEGEWSTEKYDAVDDDDEYEEEYAQHDAMLNRLLHGQITDDDLEEVLSPETQETTDE